MGLTSFEKPKVTNLHDNKRDLVEIVVHIFLLFQGKVVGAHL
jgi:hypothetical protein